MIEKEQIAALARDARVVELLDARNYIELAKVVGRKCYAFTAQDEENVDTYWNIAYERGWILFTEELVSEKMGIANASEMHMALCRKLKAEFDDEFDFKCVEDGDNEEMWISKDGFSSLLFLTKTEQSKRTRLSFSRVLNVAGAVQRLIFENHSLRIDIYNKSRQIEEASALIAEMML
jgi:hypothetical protein